MVPLLNRGGMMKGFVQEADRQQTTLLPECLDDWVGESNPVRAVDVFVDALAGQPLVSGLAKALNNCYILFNAGGCYGCADPHVDRDRGAHCA